MIERGIFEHLSSDTAVGAFVGDSAFARVFPMVVPQKALNGDKRVPCVVYTLVGEERQKMYCGTSRLVQVSVVIDCYAATLAEARNLSNAVKGSLIDFSGVMGDVTVRDVALIGSISLAEIDLGLMRIADTYTIWYEEES